MSQTTRKWNRLTDEKRKAFIDELILFFEQERGEQIGHIAAEQLLNFFLESVGGELYNKGIEDAKATLEQRFQDMNYDLDGLLDL